VTKPPQFDYTDIAPADLTVAYRAVQGRRRREYHDADSWTQADAASLPLEKRCDAILAELRRQGHDELAGLLHQEADRIGVLVDGRQRLGMDHTDEPMLRWRANAEAATAAVDTHVAALPAPTARPPADRNPDGTLHRGRRTAAPQTPIP
jgi:hypothetical protein